MYIKEKLTLIYSTLWNKQKHKHTYKRKQKTIQKKKCLIKDYNFNYIHTNLIKGGKCLLAIFRKRFLIYCSWWKNLWCLEAPVSFCNPINTINQLTSDNLTRVILTSLFLMPLTFKETNLNKSAVWVVFYKNAYIVWD